jgi:hypothetical protein
MARKEINTEFGEEIFKTFTCLVTTGLANDLGKELDHPIRSTLI